jgi:hypothetical protein
MDGSSGNTRPSRLIAVFQAALGEIEKEERLKGDDPALVELKNSIARTIAELEVTRDSRRRKSLRVVSEFLGHSGEVQGGVLVKKRPP